ncbi:hypothetical protein [Pantoea dispersa]|uniref:hypothetical protein n=1 Tax=Pantoea dispersa TaxID=59814 RepID=UPI000FDBFAC4|nr:hypothetical protein [Pantoea dispersa]RVU72210.1 hypothetical protein EKH82_23770 [Pantoea dispersa]
MNTWLASFQAEWRGACSEAHMLILSPDEQLAEAGCMLMGRTWWKDEPRESEGCYWRFDGNDVWLKSLVQLDAQQAATISGLHFLDEWEVTGTLLAPAVRDRCGCHWPDFRG